MASAPTGALQDQARGQQAWPHGLAPSSCLEGLGSAHSATLTGRVCSRAGSLAGGAESTEGLRPPGPPCTPEVGRGPWAWPRQAAPGMLVCCRGPGGHQAACMARPALLGAEGTVAVEGPRPSMPPPLSALVLRPRSGLRRRAPGSLRTGLPPPPPPLVRTPAQLLPLRRGVRASPRPGVTAPR